METVNGWIVINFWNDPLNDRFFRTRREAIKDAELFAVDTWRHLKKCGYRCVKAQIREGWE